MSAVTMDRRRFGQLSLGGASVALLGGCAGPLASPAFLDNGGPSSLDGLVRAAPEEVGVSPARLLTFLDEVASAGRELHSFMMLRHGKVFAEGWWWPYRPDRVHMTHSLTKSVTATAAGLAIDEGRFGLDDKVVSFFPQYAPADASANLRAMTVRDLLTMETGHANETSGSLWRPIKSSWIAEFFKIPVPHRPGTFFKYTSAASYMLSAIVTRTTGQTAHAYLTPRVLEPMGITNLRWDISPDGVNPGGNGLSWTTADSLKLGALHAQRGVWNGQRLLSEAWVREATRRQSGDGEDSYGYHWWMGPGSAYYGLGLFTQLAIVFPEHDTTLAFFSAINGSSKLLPLVWKHFPDALGAASLPPSAAYASLRERTAGLRLLPPLPGTHSPREASLSGRTFAIEPNDQGVSWVAFDFTADACSYRMADSRGEHRIVAGLNRYLEQGTTMSGARLHHEYEPADMPVVAGAEWIDANTMRMTWQFVESAFRDTVTCRFDGPTVRIDRSVNLNSAATSLPTLVGR